MTERPESSESEEQRLLKSKDGGSNPPRGSNAWLYLVVRKEMTGGALLSQVSHAASEAGSQWTIERGHEIPKDARACILGATKEELAKARFDLTSADVSYCAIEETDGPLAGCVTALGFVTDDRDGLRAAVPLLATLRPWREPK